MFLYASLCCYITVLISFHVSLSPFLHYYVSFNITPYYLLCCFVDKFLFGSKSFNTFLCQYFSVYIFIIWPVDIFINKSISVTPYYISTLIYTTFSMLIVHSIYLFLCHPIYFSLLLLIDTNNSIYFDIYFLSDCCVNFF